MTTAPHTAYPYTIPLAMFKEQRERLGASLSQAFPNETHAAFLQGGSEVPINSTDCNYLFVQESYFYYLFGVEIPDCFGLILSSGKGILFIPRYPSSYAVWMGELPTPEHIKKITEIDEVYYTDEMEDIIKKNKKITTLEVLKGVNTDSGLSVLTAVLPEKYSEPAINYAKDWLFFTLSQQRCYKTKMEADLLAYVCKQSSAAHIHVMQHCKPLMSQHMLESSFLHHVYYYGGCRKVSYTCICATGHHGAILHYPDNNALIKDNDMALLDMGGQYKGYASDITCSFPVNGKFNENQKIIYNAVLNAHDKVLHAMKPGVSWVDMHRLALKTMGEHLIKAQILIGSITEIMEKKIMGLFQPHGLGHLIGIDVHDVGGYIENCPERPSDEDCCKLRTARVLEKDFYITVEPGCYINRVLLEQAFQNPQIKHHFNEKKLRELWDFGGVRIESDVLVTEDGVINFTLVPRTVEEIESTMAGRKFHKEVEVYKNGKA